MLVPLLGFFETSNVKRVFGGIQFASTSAIYGEDSLERSSIGTSCYSISVFKLWGLTELVLLLSGRTVLHSYFGFTCLEKNDPQDAHESYVFSIAMMKLNTYFIYKGNKVDCVAPLAPLTERIRSYLSSKTSSLSSLKYFCAFRTSRESNFYNQHTEIIGVERQYLRPLSTHPTNFSLVFKPVFRVAPVEYFSELVLASSFPSVFLPFNRQHLSIQIHALFLST